MLIAVASILTVLMLLVVYFDVTRFIIPNWLNGVVLALWIPFLFITPVEIEWWWSLATLAGFFTFGFLIFSLNIMGGGDVKLLIAIAPWLGYTSFAIIYFLFLMGIAGGVLALFVIMARLGAKKIYGEETVQKKLPKFFHPKSPLPYGVAIAYAFGYMIWTNQIQGLII